MTTNFEDFSEVAKARRSALLARITENYGAEATNTMDGYVSFSSKLSSELLGIDPKNPDPEKVASAVRSMAIGFNLILNTLFKPLPGKEAIEVGVDI